MDFNDVGEKGRGESGEVKVDMILNILSKLLS